MEDLITCPAPLEMLRRGSPVVHRRCRYILLTPEPDYEGVLCFASPPCNDGEDIDVEWGHVNTLTMDLTDATGRAHAWWWVLANTPRRDRIDALATSFASVWVVGERADYRPSIVHSGSRKTWLHDLGLDPTDDTRLPDGSRVVDALALKAVVEHLIAQKED